MSDPIQSLLRPAAATAGHLEKTSHLAAAVVKHASEALVLLDADARSISVNPAFIRMTGYSVNEARGMTLDELLHQSITRHNASLSNAMAGDGKAQNQWEGRVWVRRKNGLDFPAFLTINAVHGGDEQIMNFVAGFTDISDQLQYENRLSQLELRDGQTGLANRNLLTERTNQALLQAERYGRNLSMLCICLDGFSENNTVHAAHDELLKLVVQQLVAAVRASDTVARITANEFVVLLPEIEDANHVLLVADKITKSLDELSSLNVRASIGVARYPTDGQDMPGLLRHADEDRFRNKPKLLSSV